jgi:Ca2+-binding EF-hand superfamily protein
MLISPRLRPLRAAPLDHPGLACDTLRQHRNDPMQWMWDASPLTSLIIGALMRFSLCLLVVLASASSAYAQMGGGMVGGMGGGRGGGHRGQQGQGRQQRAAQIVRSASPIKRDAIDKPVAAMFRLADRNGDGLVTLAELQSVIEARRDARLKAAFSRIDANHDGSISQAEFYAWQHALGSAAGGDEQSAIEGPVAETLAPEWKSDHTDEVLARIVEPLNATMLTAANTNYDAGTSLDELLVYERARLDRFDTDHDGILSAEEQRAMFPRRQRGFDDDGPQDVAPTPPAPER